MAVKLEDRPIDQVREECIDKLIVNYSHAIISQAAFERRLDEMMAATEHQVLLDLVADLPKEADKQYAEDKQSTFAPSTSSTDTAADKVVSILSSNSRKGPWLVPKKMVIIDVLGSVELDFSQATFADTQVEIEVKSFLGSVSIAVPEDVAVVSRVTNILASSEEHAPPQPQLARHTIVVTGMSLLGSVDVSVKRSMRERWVEFANSMREAFGLERRT